MKRMWYRNAVIYEIFTRSFYDSNGDGIGDVKGIIEKLDYLDNLGIDVIWLTPIYASPNEDAGYDVSDYYQINEEYGVISDVELLIREAHKRNIKIIMELVANHTSIEHMWFKSARKSKKSIYRDFYIWRDNSGDEYPNNWMSSRTGKPVWTYVEETDSYYFHLYTSHQPDLNWRNEELRKEIYKIIKFWLNKGVDGFRLDVINKISKKEGLPDLDDSVPYHYAEMYFENQPLVHEYIHNMRKEILNEYPDCIFMGQTSGIDLDQAYEYTLGEKEQLDLFLQFELTDMDKGPEGRLKQFDLEKFKDIIFKWQDAFDGKLWNTIFLGSHDLPRMVSHYGDDENYREKSAKMLATVQLFLRGTQIIYMGDEIGMTNVNYKSIDDYNDNRTKNFYYKRINERNENEEKVFMDIHDISRDNARYPIQWNDSIHGGFSSGKPWIKENDNYEYINVESQLNDENSIFEYYKKLIKIRKSERTLIEGKTTRLNYGEGIIAYRRIYNDISIDVIANFTNVSKRIDIVGNGERIIGNYDGENYQELKPYEVVVFKNYIC